MMDLLKDVIKSVTSRFVHLTVDGRIIDYRSNFVQYQNMMTRVTMESDKALMTFSIAALAALAVLNDAVFKPYGWLSFITFTCFVLVVVTVMVGYHVSKALLIDAQRIITRNFKESLTAPLGEGLSKVRFAKLSKAINFVGLALFIVGMISFVVLMALYIKGVS